MKRYDPVYKCDQGFKIRANMEEDELGDYVLYEDVERLRCDLTHAKGTLETVTKGSFDGMAALANDMAQLRADNARLRELVDSAVTDFGKLNLKELADIYREELAKI